jgi:O-antigen ligase
MPVRTTARDVPDPTPVLFGLAVMAAWAILFLEAGTLKGTILTVVALPVLATLVIRLGTHPFLATVTLIAASVISRHAVNIANLNARAEHLMAVLLLLALPWLWNARERRIEWTRADWLLVGYMAANLVSSMFMSPDAKQTTKWAIQQLMAIAPYFFLRLMATRESAFRRAFQVLLWVGLLEAAYAVAGVYANLFLGTEFALSLEQYEGIPASFGTLYEPNFLGAYCGTCMVMMAVMYMKERRPWYLLGYMISFAGMAVSFSRAALLAGVMVLLLAVFMAIRNKWMNGAMFCRMALATAVVVTLLAPIMFRSYQERFSTVQVGDITADPNTMTRTVQLAMGVDQFLDHPILGNGTASFQLLFDWEQLGQDWEALGWLGNTEIRVLHDTGLIGFGLFIAFLLALLRPARRLMRREGSTELTALMMGCVVYLFTFQATEGSVMAFCWVHLGLIACALAAYGGDRGGNLRALPQR